MHKTSLALAIGAIVLAGTSFPAAAQAQRVNPLEAARPLPQGPSRWIADYRFLKDPAKRTDPLDAVRYHELGDSSWLVLSGDARYTYRTVGLPYFGLVPAAGKNDSFWMQRLQLNADLHLFDDALRAFVQFQNTSSWGAKLSTLRDANGSDIGQAFVDFNFGLGNTKTTIRAGRQEILFGQGALFNIGDLRNVRLAFDGIRATARTKDGKKLDLVALQPIEYETGAMNNRADENTQIYGAYGTLPLGGGKALDVYAFTRHIEQRAFQGSTGEEDRHTIGTRFFGDTEKFRWTWDVMAQAGEHAGRDISAWGVRSVTRYKLESAHALSIGMHFDLASGGKPNGATTHTFDPLYPKNGEYGLAGVTTQSNAIIVGPEIAFSPVPKSDVYVSAMKVWRQNPHDHVYMAGMRPVPGTLANDDRDVGVIYQFGSRWAATRNVTFDLDFMQMSAGSAVKQAGGRDTRAMEARISLAF